MKPKIRYGIVQARAARVLTVIQLKSPELVLEYDTTIVLNKVLHSTYSICNASWHELLLKYIIRLKLLEPFLEYVILLNLHYILYLQRFVSYWRSTYCNTTQANQIIFDGIGPSVFLEYAILLSQHYCIAKASWAKVEVRNHTQANEIIFDFNRPS